MPIYKLTPIDATHPDWECSSLRREVIVRAENQQQARAAVARATEAMARLASGRDLPLTPWKQSARASAEEIQTNRWSSRGAVEILEPAQYDEELQRIDSRH